MSINGHAMNGKINLREFKIVEMLAWLIRNSLDKIKNRLRSKRNNNK